jgi:multiple sugar transport system ATP-binding protein
MKLAGAPKEVMDQEVQKAARILGLEQLLHRFPRQLSGGQRQRVAMGRAIVRNPQVFLFDEPLSNLDAKLRVQMRTELEQLHHKLRTTTVYVTHDQVEAMTLGDRIVLMNHGVIQQVDAPLAIYRRPANRFVASFIGSPTMNFFAGVIRDGAFVVAGEGARLPLGAEGSGLGSVQGAALLPQGPAVLGIRPEDLVTEPGAVPFTTAEVEVAEQMGHETLAHVSVGGSSHVVRVPGDRAACPGDRLSLGVRPGAAHLFAADDEGRRLN